MAPIFDANLLLLVQFGSTWAMVGVIWFVQVVHYPLMSRVGPQGFRRYEEAHRVRTSWVVVPLMLTELAANLLLLWIPNGLSIKLIGLGLVLLLVIWSSTFLLQVLFTIAWCKVSMRSLTNIW